ncbi:hypothetical protein ACFLSY_11545, partial [Bacteroidota bacterium]
SIILFFGLFFIIREPIYTDNEKLAEAIKMIDLNDPQVKEVYSAFPVFESIMESNLRSLNDNKIICPKISEGFFYKKNIKFQWEANAKEILTLKIYDNKGKEIFLVENPKGNKYKLRKKLSPGLYYWKLENSKEIVLLSNFKIIRKPK